MLPLYRHFVVTVYTVHPRKVKFNFQFLPDDSVVKGSVGADIRGPKTYPIWEPPAWAQAQANQYAKDESAEAENLAECASMTLTSLVNTYLQGLWADLKGVVTVEG